MILPLFLIPIFVFIVPVKGALLNLYLFQNLINIDIQYIEKYKRKVKETYVPNNSSLIFEHVQKEINLKRNHVQYTIKGVLKNIHSEKLDRFVYLIPYHEAWQVSNFEAKNEEGEIMEVDEMNNINDLEEIFIDRFNNEINVNDFEIKVCQIYLKNILKKNEQVFLEFHYILGQPYFPFPTEITYMEEQKLLFFFSPDFLSPYKIKKQKPTRIQLCDDCNITIIDEENFMKGFQKIDKKIYVNEQKYNIQDFTLQQKVLVYFTLHNNLGYFQKVKKKIQISHFGFIKETEEYMLNNNAAIIKHFDRYKTSELEQKYTTWEINEERKNVLNKEIDRNEQTREKEQTKGKEQNEKWQKTTTTKDETKNSKEEINQSIPKSTIIFSMLSEIPYNIFSYNYFDELGKIYLMRGKKIYNKKNKKIYFHFFLKPRYPLLGKWKAQFSTSFTHNSNLFYLTKDQLYLKKDEPQKQKANMETLNNLKKKNQETKQIKSEQQNTHQTIFYIYKIDILPSIKSFYIKQLDLDITLPIFATNIVLLNTKTKNINYNITRKKGWIDFFTTRKVVQIKMKNIFPQSYNKSYEQMYLIYNYTWFNIFLKPIAIILILFLLILFVFLVFRTKQLHRFLILSFDTKVERNIKCKRLQFQLLKESSKELFENLYFLSDELIRKMEQVRKKKETVEISDEIKNEILKLADSWNNSFIFHVLKFEQLMKEKKYNDEYTNLYINKCYDYHKAVKRYSKMVVNGLDPNLKDIDKVEENILENVFL